MSASLCITPLKPIYGDVSSIFSRSAFWMIFCFVMIAIPSQAQTSAYLYSWAPMPGSNPAVTEYGYVEQADGHLHLEIPLGDARLNRSGSGSSQPRLVYDSNFWYPDLLGSTYNWAPGASWHLLPTYTHYSVAGYPGSNIYQEVDTNGVPHDFPCASSCYSTEGHGYWFDGTSVYGPDGSLVVSDYPSSIYWGRVTDANGNYTSLLPFPQGNTRGQESQFVIYDTSNIPFFYFYTQNPSSGVGSVNSPGPFQDDLYQMSGMDSAGGNQDFLEHEVSIQVNTAFNESRVYVAECVNSGEYTCTAHVISQIVLPDQTSYNFKYDCDSTIPAQQTYCTSPHGQAAYYGGLTQMTTPTGRLFTYSYQPFFDAHEDASLGLQSRSNGDGTWTYAQATITQCAKYSDVGCEQTLTTVEPNGRTKITTNILNNGSWPIGELVTGNDGHSWSMITTQWDFSKPNASLGYGAAYVQKLSETTTQWDSTGAAETSKTAYTYDSSQTGNITVRQLWGYNPGTNPSFGSSPDVTTYTSYYSPSSSPIVDPTTSGYSKGGTNIINKPLSITTCSGSGTSSSCHGTGSVMAQKLFTYDQYGSTGPSSASGVTNHDDGSYGSSQLIRGNPTSVATMRSNGQYINQSMSYDTTGQLTSTTDGNSNATIYSYADNYFIDNLTSSPSAYHPTLPTHAHVTTVTLPAVHGQSFSTTNGYYYGDQKLAIQTDVNGNSTFFHYADSLDRLTQVVYPLGWTLNQYTSPTQIDVYRALTTSTPSSACSSCLHTTTHLDGLERVIQTTDAAGAIVSTVYNSMGLVQSITNPYVTTSDATYGTTSYVYDILDRLCMQNNQDNVLTQPAGCTAKGSSAQQFSYVVNGGYRADENGTQWGYFYDPLGRLNSVIEPNGTTTQYTHDVLGNLLGVSQPSMQRSFTYDGLSRLVTSSNPESGGLCYGTGSASNCANGYDSNSNLRFKTDARGVLTSLSYDSWNRLIGKSYSDGSTPSSCYEYDGAGVTNGKGRITAAWTQASGTACTGSQASGFAPVAGQYITLRSVSAYDSMGRVVSEQQCTPSNCNSSAPYSLSLGYDLAGNPISLTNTAIAVPGGTSPLTLTYGYDSAGRQNSLTSNWQDSVHPGTLFNASSFYPQGPWKAATYGANLGLIRSYNTRLRISGETDTDNGARPATIGSAVLVITGNEKSQ